MASEEEPNNDEESLDVLYLDLPDETVKKFVEKHISPSVIASKKFLAKYLPICIQFCREKIAKGKKSWQENLGPRSKKIIHSGAQSFSNQISKINKKVPNLVGPKANNNLAKIKIKTNSYLNPKNKNKLSPVLLTIWGVVKNLRFLFIKTNRRYLYGILILLFLSVGYTKLKYNNDKRSQKTKEIQLLNSFDKADQDFRKVKEDLALGKTVSNEKVYEVLATAEKSKEIPANQEKAESLIKEINSLLDERTKTIRLYSDKSANFAENLVSIVLSGNSIYGINREGKIYNLDTREKEGKLIASLDKSNGEPVALTVAEQKSSIILSTAKNLLFSMNLQSKTIEELKINSDPNTNTWSSSKSLATYSSNIYLLSSENGVVWKHSLKDSGYTKGTSYLDTKKISIRGAVDFAVDGNIYVLSNEGTVLKFVKGTLEPDFNIKDIPGPHNQILVPKRIFTEEDTNSIFVLDKKYERIIKFDKSGDFSTQYVLDGKPIDDFVVNAKLQKIWILSQGKIYEGNL
jgi:hypothetical protein